MLGAVHGSACFPLHAQGGEGSGSGFVHEEGFYIHTHQAALHTRATKHLFELLFKQHYATLAVVFCTHELLDKFDWLVSVRLI